MGPSAHLDDVDLVKLRITVADDSRPLDELTAQPLLDWLADRRERWPAWPTRTR